MARLQNSVTGRRSWLRLPRSATCACAAPVWLRFSIMLRTGSGRRPASDLSLPATSPGGGEVRPFTAVSTALRYTYTSLKSLSASSIGAGWFGPPAVTRRRSDSKRSSTMLSMRLPGATCLPGSLPNRSSKPLRVLRTVSVALLTTSLLASAAGISVVCLTTARRKFASGESTPDRMRAVSMFFSRPLTRISRTSASSASHCLTYSSR
ncbi:hypothetical protein D9M68_662140 [compost metagenome]